MFGLPDDGTWDVTYQISGDESGPLIGTFSMYGNAKYDVNEEFLSTPSENTAVRVKVLSVELLLTEGFEKSLIPL